MPLSEFTIKLIETKLTEYCERRIPIDIRDQVNLTFKIIRDKVTLIETRPYFRNPSIWTESPVAQFRFDNENNKWTLYCMDRNSRWHLYDLIKPSADFDDMLKALDDDRTGIFWG
jgi:frataxin-like iron-binding protein CyaY